jgi:diphosphomevalonate decarboxylase
MSRKSTVVAPSNIALIKYWGTRDLGETLPFNPSFSMTLRECTSRTTVAPFDGPEDVVLARGSGGELEKASAGFTDGVVQHLDRLRRWAGHEERFRVATENSFPMGAGMASSASGFAALALSFVASLGEEIDGETASRLARQSGSGSAARSVMGGYVEWPAAGNDDGAASQVFPAGHWDLRDVVAILDTTEKKVSSRAGHKRAETSPYFETRLRELTGRLEEVRQAVATRDFGRLAPVVEEEAIDLHLIAMSSRPPVFYWLPGSVAVLRRVRELRRSGVEVCSTMDAGANVHLICTPAAEERVVEALGEMPEVLSVIRDGVGEGPRSSDRHLF